MKATPATLTLVLLAWLHCVRSVSALPWPHHHLLGRLAKTAAGSLKRRITLPITRKKVSKQPGHARSEEAGATGLGDLSDLLYTVSIGLGNIETTVHLDTGSSDLWVISDACRTGTCAGATATRYPMSSFQNAGEPVTLRYGDSSTGTSASGPVGKDTATLAGVSVDGQPFAAMNFTDNNVVSNGAAGIFGLGFPSGSEVQASVVDEEFNNPPGSDDFVTATSSAGPLLSRLSMLGEIAEPLFAITLQRDTIDISGSGALTIGELPEGVDNSSITWVPVRLYSELDGGLPPPTFLPTEVYPLRWEVVLDGVYLDGVELPVSSVDGTNTVSALIDTGNSLLRGPADTVKTIYSAVSPAFSSGRSAQPTYPCDTPHTLAFKIGGQLFPVDPRDFVAQASAGDADTCVAANVVSTDAPGNGALFSWSLGDPFLKSNLVVFYYGNLTHPSVDPPRMGFLSTVPNDASAQLQEAVSTAEANGGNFASTTEAAPTGTLPLANPASPTTASASAPAASATAPSPSSPLSRGASTPKPSGPAASPSASSSASQRLVLASPLSFLFSSCAGMLPPLLALVSAFALSL